MALWHVMLFFENGMKSDYLVHGKTGDEAMRKALHTVSLENQKKVVSSKTLELKFAGDVCYLRTKPYA